MAGILEVCIGWFLGIGSSYLFRIRDRLEKKNNFINGIQAELLELLSRLVGNIYLMKSQIGQLDHDFLKWVDLVCSNMQLELIPDQDIRVKKLLTYPPDELAKASMIIADHKTGLSLSLNLFYLDYMNKNIDILPLMDNQLQKLIIEVMNRIKFANQEIEQYQFYFKKTFDSSLSKKNHDILNINIIQLMTVLSNELIKLVDKITNLLSIIEKIKMDKPAFKIRKMVAELINFKKKRL